MSSVYGGSTINIAAASAIDGSEGCVLKQPELRQKVRIEGMVDWCRKEYNIVSEQLYQDSVAQTHLASRAWALQERLLAPRTLHFSKSGLFWECRLRDACEAFRESIPEMFAFYVNHRGKRPLAETWDKVVYLYSQADLTYSSDKLVVLSGIARAAQNENKDQYLAGMWRKDIEAKLCWRTLTLDLEKLPLRPSCYWAPSWSWAALDVQVIYTPWEKDRISQCELYSSVIDAWVTPFGSDPFGQLS
jgi:hypothetical protein